MNCGKLLECVLRCLCFDTISISLIDCFPYILAVYLTMLFFLGITSAMKTLFILAFPR